MAFSFGKMNDPDATLFIQVSELTGSTERGAIVDLVKDLKSNNLWSKMKAVYPFVGGTAASHKWNLKDPRDVDAAFRLTFSGGWTHSSTGALPNGTTGYADTFLVPATHLTENTTHLSYYSRTNTNTLSADIGSAGANPNRLEIVIRDNSWSISDHYNYNTNRVFITNLSDARGFFVSSRTTSTSHKYWRNNSQISSTNTGTSSGFSSLTNKTYLALLAIPGGGSYYGDKECAFATIGDGLTDADATNLYTIVQKYQTTLGRQV